MTRSHSNVIHLPTLESKAIKAFDILVRNPSELFSTDRVVGIITRYLDALSKYFYNVIIQDRDNSHNSLFDDKKVIEESKERTLMLLLVSACQKFGLPIARAEHAYLALTGEILPLRAPVAWADRAGDDARLDPIEFLNKHWGAYIEKGIFFQVDLRTLDNPLFEAVRIYVRRHKKGEDPKAYLPPPNESRFTRASSGPRVDLYAALGMAAGPLRPTPGTNGLGDDHPRASHAPG